MFYKATKRSKPQILLAPLIDCLFLLLIFFMSTTVFPENAGIEVEKPKAETGKSLPKEHIIFAVSRDGNYYYAGNRRSLAEISEIIKSEITMKPGSTVIVQVDKQSIADNLIQILDTARKARAKNIAIATKPAEEK